MWRHLVVILFFLPSSLGDGNNDSFVAKLFENYNGDEHPNVNKSIFERQVLVGVNIYIVHMYTISESNMDYSLTMFLRERWLDQRLTFAAPENVTRLELAFSSMDRVWLPDLFLLNEKTAIVHDITVPNKLLHIYPDGTVQLSQRVTGTFACDMDLWKFPFDTQECNLELESYGMSTENLKFKWTENAITSNENMSFPQFSLKEMREYDCTKGYYGIYFTCIGVAFVLDRNYGYFVIQIFVPSALIVILSWVNFWLDCESVPARISLGLLTVLTMTTQSSGARASLPRVSYVKAIDVWMAVCLMFVFAALVEFAYVNVLCRISKQREMDDRRSAAEKDSVDDKSLSESDIKVSAKRSSAWPPCLDRIRLEDRALCVDRVSRVVFPLLYVLFNLWYWIFYLVIH